MGDLNPFGGRDLLLRVVVFQFHVCTLAFAWPSSFAASNIGTQLGSAILNASLARPRLIARSMRKLALRTGSCGTHLWATLEVVVAPAQSFGDLVGRGKKGWPLVVGGAGCVWAFAKTFFVSFIKAFTLKGLLDQITPPPHQTSIPSF